MLKRPDIPTNLRICAGTDGSVTFLLELLTGKSVKVETLEQNVIKASQEVSKILEIEEGEDVNSRLVVLKTDGTVYVLARSLSPVKRMPPAVKKDIMKADIPIGRILRDYKIETRRDIINMEIVKSEFFRDIPVLSREYLIIHNKNILMWINEFFPVDERWNVNYLTL